MRLVVLILGFVGCSSAPYSDDGGIVCVPGEYSACTCAGGASGSALCLPGGKERGACSCSASDAGADLAQPIGDMRNGPDMTGCGSNLPGMDYCCLDPNGQRTETIDMGHELVITGTCGPGLACNGLKCVQCGLRNNPCCTGAGAACTGSLQCTYPDGSANNGFCF